MRDAVQTKTWCRLEADTPEITDAVWIWRVEGFILADYVMESMTVLVMMSISLI